MSAPSFMKMYWADYEADTSDLSLEEHGLYLMLIKAYWERQGPLPFDDRKLARLVGSNPRTIRKLWKSVRHYFKLNSGSIPPEFSGNSARNIDETNSIQPELDVIRHERIDREIAKVEAKSMKAKRSAEISAQVRRERTLEQPHKRTLSYKITDIDIGDSTPSTPESGSETPVQGKSQSQRDEGFSSPFSDLSPPKGDWGKLVWNEGVPWLARVTGNKKPGSLIGKWRRDLQQRDDALWRIISSAHDNGVTDPISYIAKAVHDQAASMSNGQRYDDRDPRHHVRRDPSMFSDAQWVNCMESCRENRVWAKTWGPPPWNPGCHCPKKIIDEYRPVWLQLAPQQRSLV